nr:hypothetical protein 5 [bacterium]
MTQIQLEQCVSYFTQGSLVEWIAGGITVVFLLVTAFTKANLPGVIKTVAGKVMDMKSHNKGK